MAFGRPSFAGGGAGSVHVGFRADTGQFKADVSEARQIYQRSTGQMSDAALRMAVAQEKLDRAIHRFGPESRQAKEATLAWRRELKALEQQSDRTGRELAQLDSRHAAVAGGLRARTAGLVGGFAGLRSGVGALGLSMIGTAGLTAAFASSLNAASSLEEEISKSRMTFGDASDDVERYATTTAKSIGVARDKALAYASQLGGILNASGLVRAESAKLGVEFVQLGGDMASFNNANPAETLEAIRAGLVGEYEPLRRYQVLLSEARVSQEALRLSGKAAKDELTEREKVLARVNLIMGQTADQQGDAARTGGNYAGQVRKLNAQLRDLQTSGGELALPVVTDLVAMMNEGAGAANSFAGALRTLGDVEIPGTSSRLGSWAMWMATNTGPFSGFNRLRQLRDLIGGDDPDDDPIGSRGDRDRPNMGRAVPGPRRRGRPRRTEADILLDVARSGSTRTTTDDLARLSELRALYRRQIAELERRKKLSDEQKERLRGLYGSLESVQSQIGSLVDASESELAVRKEAAARKGAERRAAERARLATILDAASEDAERQGRLRAGTGGNRVNMRRRALEHVDETIAGLRRRSKDADRPITRAELDAALFNFARDLHGVIGQFGSNIAGDPMMGQLATHAHAQTSLMLRQNELLEKLYGAGGFPGTAYTRSALSAAGIGSGF